MESMKPQVGSLQRSTKLINPYPDWPRRKEKKLKLLKLEMKKRISLPTLQ